MKILKYVLSVVIGVILLALVILFFANKNTKTLEHVSNVVTTKRDEAEDDKSIASLKSISASIMLFEYDKNKVPVSIAELNEYIPISEFVSSTVKYTASTTKNFDYVACAPYTKDSVKEKNTDNLQWFLSSGMICVHSQQR